MARSLILGGARSGKTNFAQNLAIQSGSSVSLIVTAQAQDAEMAARIEKHRQSRPDTWQVVEAPQALPWAIQTHCQAGRCVMVDCLTLWLSNVLCQPGEVDVAAHTTVLVQAVSKAAGRLILVSNEVGWGIVPDNALARQFRDEAGRLHQQLAQVCDEVTLVVAGLPWHLKQGAAEP